MGEIDTQAAWNRARRCSAAPGARHEHLPAGSTRQCAGRAIPHRLLEVNLMIHDAARLITGETLYIDGGYHIID
jgi:hypothetical protein